MTLSLPWATCSGRGLRAHRICVCARDLGLHQSKESLWCCLWWFLERPRWTTVSFTLSALGLREVKASQGGGFIANLVWIGPNTSLMVRECGLFFGSLCKM